MFLELFHLFLSKVVLVRGITLERKRVIRILRVLFVIDVSVSIVPIREISRIR